MQDIVSVTPFDVGRLRFDLTDVYNLPGDHPFAGQVVNVPLRSYHIALPGRSVLVDAVGCDLQEIPEAFRVPDYAPPPGLLEQLASAGIAAGDISDVIITHAHFDHYGALSTSEDGRNRPSFPNARHYLNKADWKPQRFDALDQRTLGLIERHGLLQLTSGEVSLGDGLTILPMPGESPGHQIVHAAAGKQSIYFAGDLYHHPLEFADGARDVKWAARKSMRRSKLALIKRMVESGGLAYFTHMVGAYRVREQEAGTVVWHRVQVASDG